MPFAPFSVALTETSDMVVMVASVDTLIPFEVREFMVVLESVTSVAVPDSKLIPVTPEENVVPCTVKFSVQAPTFIPIEEELAIELSVIVMSDCRPLRM